jgi:hypothetical protein
MTIMIEIEYGSGDDGEWTSRIDVLFICRSIGAEDCWSLSLRRGSISNNRRGQLTCRLTTKVGTPKTPSLCVCGMAL